VLSSLPAPAPWPIVVVQHVDPTFAPGMTEWLARETRHRVEIVREDDALAPGRVALAATNDHLLLDQRGRLHYSAEPREAVFRPSVDAFFDSIRAAKSAAGVAVVLTGMGRDGARGDGAPARRGLAHHRAGSRDERRVGNAGRGS
jgi:chemotaxis response regulator CheB